MKLNKAPILTSLLTAGALLLSQKSKALDGIVMESITNDPIHNAIVKLYQGEELLDSARTDGEGYYRLSPNSVSPEFNLQDNRSSEIKVFDIHGRFMYNLDHSWNGSSIPAMIQIIHESSMNIKDFYLTASVILKIEFRR